MRNINRTLSSCPVDVCVSGLHPRSISHLGVRGLRSLASTTTPSHETLLRLEHGLLRLEHGLLRLEHGLLRLEHG